VNYEQIEEPTKVDDLIKAKLKWLGFGEEL
jgi:hypothetical protein